jgi:hypothetical protein
MAAYWMLAERPVVLSADTFVSCTCWNRILTLTEEIRQPCGGGYWGLDDREPCCFKDRDYLRRQGG